MSLWTETPAERQQRLADEVSGKRKRATAPEEVQVGSEEEKKRRKVYDEDLRQGVEEYTVRFLSTPLHVNSDACREDTEVLRSSSLIKLGAKTMMKIRKKVKFGNTVEIWVSQAASWMTPRGAS